MSRRPVFGGYAALLREIKSNDLKAFIIFVGCTDDYDDYDELLHPSSTRKQTVES